MNDIGRYYKRFKFGEDNFHRLMKQRIRTILLVSSFYDAFIFEQDGRLSEQVFGEYRQLNLSTAPRIISVPTGEDALSILDSYNFDLVITMMRIGTLSPWDFAERIKALKPNMPVLLLLNVKNDLMLIDKNSTEMEHIDDVFSWNGDSTLLLAMVKEIEDKWNVANDTQNGLVRVIILVEDSIEYYSKFLPVLYQEVMKQTQRLINTELDDVNKRLQMRARPKVLLCHDYESAVEYFDKYEEFVIGVISDVKFPQNNELNLEAGFNLIEYIKSHNSTLPALLNSSETVNRDQAAKLGISFLNKSSKSYLEKIRHFIKGSLGFGDFIFRDKAGNYFGKADDTARFEELLRNIPVESLLYHSRHNHFSGWLAAHGEFLVAKRIRHVSVEDFDSTEAIREFLINAFHEVKELRLRGKMVRFDPQYLDMDDVVIRLSEGSMGGKGRGLAFLNALLVSMDWEKQYKELFVRIPRTFIIGTNEFDEFCAKHNLEEFLEIANDQNIKSFFLENSLSEELKHNLRELLAHINYPLAVRSSGLLEDSQSQPFAGVYETYMLPNNHPDIEVRLYQLCTAIKLIFASVFKQDAINYIEGFNFKVEEEKMAVVIQQIAGSKQGDFFYPHVSGVAQSYNYYPVFQMQHEDGIASIVVGMGKAVVDGLKTYKFSPSWPRMNILKSDDQISEAQHDFYAVELTNDNFDLTEGEMSTYKQVMIVDAGDYDCLKYVTAYWDAYNQKLVDGKYEKGSRIISFANILKYNDFPFADSLKKILEIGTAALGVPVEIEFALDLEPLCLNKKAVLYILQIRPMNVNQDVITLKKDDLQLEQAWLFSDKAMGNGRYEMQDIVVVDPEMFDITKTLDIVNEIEQVNTELRTENKSYILIGPGRWGSSDRFLGIPVKWNQINGAKIIVETTLENFRIAFSQGTHFFHNLIAQNTGYVYLDKDGHLDWDWILSQTIINRYKYIVHIRTKVPFRAELSGVNGLAIIYKQ
ncbi:MAG: PEP/pyruvate-binding domain-containing protein [Candidatus Stygibacter australis]|nr:PEP/pyruvate-binding domain-containing protein [Candidatus Stygibacter australis]MDP8320893.1 PEP/pyruvate-binding domain-containing protein [Candidatus Stygibacter australis]